MQMSVIFADERCPGQKQWLILPGEKTQRARVKWDERVVQVDVPGYSLGGPPHCPLFFLKQIDYRRSAGMDFGDLVSEKKRARLNFALLKQGTQEPGLQLDRCRFGHLLFLGALYRSQGDVGNAGRARAPRTCKFAAAPVT